MSLKYYFQTRNETSARAFLISHLKKLGFEVEEKVKPWTVIRFRRTAPEQTVVYSGLTAKASRPRKWFRVVGPEEGIFREDEELKKGMAVTEIFEIEREQDYE